MKARLTLLSFYVKHFSMRKSSMLFYYSYLAFIYRSPLIFYIMDTDSSKMRKFAHPTVEISSMCETCEIAIGSPSLCRGSTRHLLKNGRKLHVVSISWQLVVSVYGHPFVGGDQKQRVFHHDWHLFANYFVYVLFIL